MKSIFEKTRLAKMFSTEKEQETMGKPSGEKQDSPQQMKGEEAKKTLNMSQNSPLNIVEAIHYLQTIVEQRLTHYFGKNKSTNRLELPPLTLSNTEEPLARFIKYYQLSTEESIMLLISLVPHLQPTFFDALVGAHLPKGGDFPAIGGIKGENQRNMLPTGETVLFLLAGDDLSLRLQLQGILSDNHFLSKEKIVYLDSVKSGEPKMSGKLILDQEYVELLTTGMVSIPKMSNAFPAKYISTALDWEDLVLNPQTMAQIKEIEDWVIHNPTLMNDWGMQKKLKPGYRALFHGPPGTGKTLTASLLGKYTNQPVFRVDLSMVVSKYIGETEKNLAKLFDKAQYKNWILFFDEADSIFGKRTNVRDAHDKYANQEVSYLLQRIESYPGLTILATNFKGNIDDAFTRRFNSFIYFPKPKATERLKIWEKAFPKNVRFAEEVNFTQIAQKYELTGSNIMNVVQNACLSALKRDTETIELVNIRKGIQKEYSKEGRVWV